MTIARAAAVEELAAYAHNAWAGWMKYQGERGGAKFWDALPSGLSKRWQRQMFTAYADLPEAEKESDRKEARRILAVIAKHLDAAKLAEAILERQVSKGDVIVIDDNEAFLNYKPLKATIKAFYEGGA